jgi:hypothetical protein
MASSVAIHWEEIIMANKSNVIKDINYLVNQTLIVTFISGRVYEYYGVPMDVASAFIHADSRGRFYNSFIKNRYSCNLQSRQELPDNVVDMLAPEWNSKRGRSRVDVLRERKLAELYGTKHAGDKRRLRAERKGHNERVIKQYGLKK